MKTKPIKLSETPQVYDILTSSDYWHIDSNRACGHERVEYMLSVVNERVLVTARTTQMDKDYNEISTKTTSRDIGSAVTGGKVYRKDGGYLKIAQNLPGIECIAVI